MAGSLPYIINLGNSIIGVSVLAMPFCFSQVGILLGTILLLGSATITEISCTLLMRAALSSKRRSYEFLAHHTYGAAGKLAVEVCTIGMLIGSMIAFHVIIGDLGPTIISKALHINNTPTLRALLLIVLAVCVVTPLGLLRNIESLNNVSALSIGFYSVFVAQIFGSAFPQIWSGAWIDKVNFWRPEGIFRCVPIFALAFGCQTQLFVMYDALPDPSLKQMNSIIRSAVGMCTSVYLAVGFFGYIAYCDSPVILGDILMHFKPTIISQAIKCGFVLSVAVSFPLCIFPCRASIYTLLFSEPHGHHHENIGGVARIPEAKFRIITLGIIGLTLVIGIMVPSVEFVLGLTGSTMGSLICFIFPSIMFISVMSNSKLTSKSSAQFVLFLGVTLLLVSTYTTLNSHDKEKPVVPPNVQNDKEDINKIVITNSALNGNKPVVDLEKHNLVVEKKDIEKIAKVEEKPAKRLEPVVPHAPEEKQDVQKDAIEKVEIKEAVKPKEPVTDTQIGLKPPPENKKTEDEKKPLEEQQHELIKKLEKQQEEQKQLLVEQKEILKELKMHKEDHKNDKPVVKAADEQQAKHPAAVVDANKIAAENAKKEVVAAAGDNQGAQVTKVAIQKNIQNNQKLVEKMQVQEKIINEAQNILNNDDANKPVDGNKNVAPAPHAQKAGDAKIQGLNSLQQNKPVDLSIQDNIADGRKQAVVNENLKRR